jgi:hypothetical protein
MKQKAFYLILVLIGVADFSIAQSNNFEITSENPELIHQYVVIEKDSMSIENGYNKIMEWIKISYNTPSEVIKASLENQYIRIEGINSNITTQNVMGTNVAYKGRYSITFEFKENKIKMELTNLEVYNTPSQYSRGGWVSQNPSLSSQLNKKGKIRKGIKQYNDGFLASLNSLKNSIVDYLNNENKSVVKKDDW